MSFKFVRQYKLGRETINGVEAYIFAAGTKIATHREGNGTTTNSTVIFHQSDASAMTGRSTHTDGTTVYARGYDDAPYELDPMGNNMDTFSPYFELTSPELPPGGMPLLPVTPLESPMMVNGQAITCEMDGVAIGCGTAMSMLEHGSATLGEIGWFTAAITGIGSHIIEIPGQNGGGNACSNGRCPDGPVTVNAPESTFIAIPFTTYGLTWQPHQQPTGGGGGGVSSATPDNKGKKATIDQKKIDDCLKSMYDAEFIGSDGNGNLNVVIDGQQVKISFRTDTAENLGKRFKEDNPQSKINGAQSGYTPGTNPLQPLIAEEIYSNPSYNFIGRTALLLHEMGNAIGGYKFKKAYEKALSEGRDVSKLKDPWNSSDRPTDQGDRDTGTDFERCAFGGIVGLRSGRIGNSREF